MGSLDKQVWFGCQELLRHYLAAPSIAAYWNIRKTFADALEAEALSGKLWIVEIGRIRIYQEEPSD